MAVIKGVNAMQTKEIAIIKNKASKSYTEFNTNIEILIPNIRAVSYTHLTLPTKRIV